jgi:spore maturation protein CgeB
MPVSVIAGYLLETERVLAQDGVVRFQMYFGKEQCVSEEDTLHLRCFEKYRFEEASRLAGLRVSQIEELKLPFQVSFEELGIFASMVTLVKEGEPSGSISDIVAALLSEKNEQQEIVTPLEFWMTYNHAKTLILEGDFERAERALLYASDVAKATSIDVGDLLSEIVNELSISRGGNKFVDKNLDILKRRFPEVSKQLESIQTKCTVERLQEGVCISLNGHALDHPTKPKSGADAWAKRTLATAKESDHLIVYGFGSGAHVRSILEMTDKKISVIEPSPDVLKAAIDACDISDILLKIENLWISDDIEPVGELLVRPQHQALFSENLSKVKSKVYGAWGLESLKPAIAVLGPMQGGTLPITEYTGRGLPVIGQKGRIINMSGFAQSYHAVEDIIKDKIRRNIVQSNLVQFLSATVIESIHEKPVDILICMAQAPISIEALSELRKQGVITVLWFAEDYLRFTYWKQVAPYYDFIFTIQKGECIEAIKKAGCQNVHYLPMGCDPGIHRPLVLSQEEKNRWGSPISFVGAGYHNRCQMFASLASHPFKIWGTEWPTCRPFTDMVQEQGRRLTPEEYVMIFNSTEINLNLHSSSERDGVDPYGDFINPRTFELAACGAFQLADRRTLMPEVFEEDKEIVLFSDINEMKDKIHYYLAHPEERIRIAEAGRRRALAEHTYAHRVKSMMSIIFAEKFDHIKSRIDQSPWKKFKLRAKPHKELSERVERAFLRGEEPTLDGLVSDIVTGNGDLTETEQKLLFLHHIKSQMIRMKREESGENK